MEDAWKIDKRSCGYAGYDGLTEFAERAVLGSEIKKDFFRNRKDAEDYIRPIVQKAFVQLIQNIMDDDECDQEVAKEYQKRGLKEIRTEEIKEDDPLYSFYHSSVPATLFVCPVSYEDDRLGECFASVWKLVIY